MPSGIQQILVAIDTVMVDAAKRSGKWLICRRGCTPCCHGVFAIGAADVKRLRAGLAALQKTDPQRAGQVRERSRTFVDGTARAYPGNRATGILDTGETAEIRFAGFANDDPCPALDPDSGACELYAARPITCRVFGPAIRREDDSISACELCYDGASDEEMDACAVELPEGVEDAAEGPQTIVAYALAL